MGKPIALTSALAIAALLACTGAQAVSMGTPDLGPTTSNIVHVWDNCGVGRHRSDLGQCVSNWAHGPGMRGCPRGYHLGDLRAYVLP